MTEKQFACQAPFDVITQVVQCFHRLLCLVHADIVACVTGWSMQLAGYIFLRRQWTEDERILNEIFSYYDKMRLPVQLLLFPEGTDFNPRSKIRSDAYALKNNLTKYEYCLHPRLKGFTYIAENMRNQFESVIDVTMGYPAGVCYGALDSFSGRFPPEVHVHIKRYPISEVPSDSDGLEAWCIKRWEEKEQRLKKLYKGQFVTTFIFQSGVQSFPSFLRAVAFSPMMR